MSAKQLPLVNLLVYISVTYVCQTTAFSHKIHQGIFPLSMCTKLPSLVNSLVHISITDVYQTPITNVYQTTAFGQSTGAYFHHLSKCVCASAPQQRQSQHPLLLFLFFLLLITAFLLLMFLHSHKQVFTSVSTQLLLSPSSFYACPSVNTIMRWTCRIQQLTAEKLTSHKRKRKKEVVLVLLQHQLARIPWLQTHTHTHSLASSTADQRPLTQ